MYLGPADEERLRVSLRPSWRAVRLGRGAIVPAGPQDGFGEFWTAVAAESGQRAGIRASGGTRRR